MRTATIQMTSCEKRKLNGEQLDDLLQGRSPAAFACCDYCTDIEIKQEQADTFCFWTLGAESGQARDGAATCGPETTFKPSWATSSSQEDTVKESSADSNSQIL